MAFSLRIILTLVISSACAVSAWAQSSATSGKYTNALEGAGWENLGTQKGVLLSRKLIDASGLFAVRGEIVIEASVGKVARVIHDHSRWIEWSATTSRVELLSKKGPYEKTVYQAFDMPLIISDRDVIYTYSVFREADVIIIDGGSQGYSGGPKSVGVRMELIRGRWFLKQTKKGHTRLVVEVLMDPKGRLPVWFVNIVQSDYPVATLTGVRSQAAKADVVPLPLPAWKPSSAAKK